MNESFENEKNVTHLAENLVYIIPTTIALAIMVLLTVFGNLLVLAALLTTPTLHTATHYLIANLAVADLLVGCFVLPFSLVLQVTGKWYFGQVFCSVWAAIDVLTCTASIFSLCVISIDRYIGVSQPLRHSLIMSKCKIKTIIVLVWLISLAISVGPLFGWRQKEQVLKEDECRINDELGYVLFSTTFSFYVPLFIILVLYAKIYSTATKQAKFLQKGINASGTLRVHTVASVKRTNNNKLATKLNLQGTSSFAQVKVTKVDNVEELELGGGKTELNCHQKAGKQPSNGFLSTQGKLHKFKRQEKAAKTLGIVVGAFILCWFPFFFLLPLCKYCFAFTDVSILFIT